MQKTAVVDRTGEWLSEWKSVDNNRRDRPLSDHLRTPLTLHPGQSPGALIDFARQKSKCVADDGIQPQMPTAPGFAPAPSVSLMYEFCKKKLINKLPLSVKHVIKSTVLSIQPSYTNPGDENTGVDGCQNDGDTGRTDNTVGEYRVHLEGQEAPLITRSVVIACSCTRPVIPQSFKAVIPESHSVNKVGSSENIVIIGGGMTAALTALREFRNADPSTGLRVTLLARRPLRKAAFSCDVGWWGIKYLHQFWQDTDPLNRLQSCRLARPSASLTPHVFDELAAAVAHSAGRLKVLEGVIGYTDEYNEQLNGNVIVKVTPATVVEDIKSPTQFQRQVASLIPEFSSRDEASTDEICASKLLFCCGNAFDTAHHPLLSLLQPRPQTVGGYPVLNMNTCEWPGLPGVFVIGAGAMLAVGPAARELAGIRLAAERIAAAIVRGIRYEVKKSEDVKVRVEDAKSNCIVENFWVEECLGPRWAVKTPRPKVCQPPVDRIDLEKETSYSSSLPKKQVPKVSLLEDEDSPFEVNVLLTVPEKVNKENVKILFTQRSVDVWIIGTEAAYSLYVPRLYGAIVPKRCSFSVSKNRVTLRLFKERDIEWKFLKG